MDQIAIPRRPVEATRVVAAVCTRQRPVMLEQCLRSLLAQHVQEGIELHIVVVENDTVPASRDLTERFAAESSYPLRYIQEHRQGVSHARNAALEAALGMDCDWLAFIDDDEEAEPDWVDSLVRVAREYTADVVRGTVVYRYPEADKWAYLRDSSGKGRSRPEGHPLKTGATNNVLIARRLFAGDALGLRFEPALNFTGGEDKLFFMQAFKTGVAGVYAPGAVVHETVPMSRCSLMMLYKDKARLAANAILIDRDFMGKRYGARRYLKLLWKEVGNTCKYLFKTLVNLHRCDDTVRSHYLKALLSMARVHGTVRGMLGKPLEGYRHIQGY